MYLWDAASRWNASLLFNMTHFFTGGGLFFPWQRESPTTVMFGDIRSETTLLIWDPTNCNWLDMKRSTYALYHSSLLTGTTGLAAGSPLGHLQIDSYLQWSNTIITVLTALFVYYDHQLDFLKISWSTFQRNLLLLMLLQGCGLHLVDIV